LARAGKLVANPLSSVPHPPSLLGKERVRGEREKAGETVLILINTSVEDTVCFR